MSRQFDPRALADAAAMQRLALDARRSVWISANAGTGKTEVLTRRLLTLLVSDPALEPRHLLALTFTKLGAAEMAARLPARLAEWAALDDAALAARVADETGVVLDSAGVARARGLAATVRQAPPLVATIHSLAQQLLMRFAVEAGIPPRFDVLEEAVQRRMLEEIQADLLTRLEGPLADSLAVLLDELGEHGWRELTGMVVNQWRRLDERLRDGGMAGILGRLERGLGLEHYDGWAAGPMLPSDTDMAALQRVAHLLPEHGAADVAHADETQREAAWRGFLLTDKDTARVKLFKKDERVAVGDADALLLETAAARVAEQVRLRKVWRGFDVTRALLLWSVAVRGEYMQRKQALGVLDYADLLDALENLLARADAGLAQWVWYGLDRRFKHLVVDEAQDNNPQQDRIVSWLAQNILSGDVGEDSARTVMAVGDVKQSIFRFQGAVPDLFLRLHDTLYDWSGNLLRVNLTHSFRSGRHVLAAVDAVFADDGTAAAVQGEFAAWPGHTPVAASRASRVEVWPLPDTGETPAVEPWALPQVRAEAGGDGADVRMFRQLGEWLKERVGCLVMPSTGKPLAWGDVLVVVQRNRVGALAAGIWRSMGIPVAATAGVVPLHVQDVATLARWIFNPDDNLALAQVLKGLRGWDDAHLLAVAEQAGDGAWFGHVAGDDAAWLAAYSAMAWEAPLKVVQRAMAEAGGPLGDYTGLLGWAEQCANLRELVVRMELEELPVGTGSGDGVRILTVQKAKGLQAPLVILPDTMQPLGDMRREKILWADGTLLVKQGSGLSEFEDGLVADEKARRAADDLRGLYVAMTRAEDWLLVCGFGKTTDKTDSWWTRVQAAVGVGAVGDEFGTVARAVVAEAVVEIPAWLAAPVEAPLKPVSSEAQLRGERVHGLLQGLDMPADEAIWAEVAGVKAQLPWIFAGGEAELAVGLPDGRVGRIDRLVEHAGEWWVVDFKTGAVPERMPGAYARQVREYMAAVRATWPERVVRSAIVWTALARLDEVTVDEQGSQ